MTRDPVREALVSARTRAWLAYVDAPRESMALRLEYLMASSAVESYDRTTPAASSDAGAQDTEKDNREADENDRNQG